MSVLKLHLFIFLQLAPLALAQTGSSSQTPEFFLEPHKSLIQVLPQKVSYQIKDSQLLLSKQEWPLKMPCEFRVAKSEFTWCQPAPGHRAEKFWVLTPQGERLFTRQLGISEKDRSQSTDLLIPLTNEEEEWFKSNNFYSVCLGTMKEGSRWSYCLRRFDLSKTDTTPKIFINGDQSPELGELVLDNTADMALIAAQSGPMHIQFEIGKQDLDTLEITQSRDQDLFRLITNSPTFSPPSELLSNGKWLTRVPRKNPQVIFQSSAGLGLIVDLFLKSETLPDPALRPKILHPPLAKTYSQRPTVVFKSSQNLKLAPLQKGSSADLRDGEWQWSWPPIPVEKISTRSLNVTDPVDAKARLTMDLERARQLLVEAQVAQGKKLRNSLELFWSWNSWLGDWEYLRSMLHLAYSTNADASQIKGIYYLRFPRGFIFQETGHYIGLGVNSINVKVLQASQLHTGASYLGWYRAPESWQKYVTHFEIGLNYWMPKSYELIDYGPITQAQFSLKKQWSDRWHIGIGANYTTAKTSALGVSTTESETEGELSLGVLL